MTKRDILNFLFKWDGSILSMWVTGSLIIIILVYSIPPAYKSEATILVEKNRSPIMRTMFMPGLDAIDVQNTEIGILLSRPVIEAVVDNLKPHEWPKKESMAGNMAKFFSKILLDLGLSSKLEPKDQWIKRLTKKIKAKPVVQSSIIKVTYYDEDPIWGAQLINELIDTYVKYHLKVFSPEGSSLLYNNKMLVIQNRIEIQLNEVDRLKKELNQPAIAETKTEYSQTMSVLAEQIINYKNQLLSMAVRFNDNHQDVVVLKRKITQLKFQVEVMKLRLIEIEVQETGINKILNNLKLDQKTFNDYKVKFENATFSELSNVDMLNIRVVQYSPVAPRPDHSRLFYILIGTFGNLILAIFIALFREYFDHRVDDPNSIENILGIPSIGSIRDQ